MGLNFPNYLARVLLNIPTLSPLKIKIANTILDMNVPPHIFEEPKKIRWHERMNSARQQFEENYEKTEDGWALKKDHHIETDLKVL